MIKVSIQGCKNEDELIDNFRQIYLSIKQFMSAAPDLSLKILQALRRRGGVISSAELQE